MKNDLQTFVNQYIETALWSSTDDKDQPMDNNFNPDDLTIETVKQITADCEKFLADHLSLIEQALEHTDLERIAHLFWLTRNRHGAGFWDGDYPKELGQKLTDAAHLFGEINLYVTDDNKLSI